MRSELVNGFVQRRMADAMKSSIAVI